MKCLIAGATGLVGGILTHQLLISDLVKEVRVIGRRRYENNSNKLKSEIIDFENINHFENIDIAFCCLGTTIKKAGTKENFIKVDKDYVANIAKSLPADCCLVIISAKGANAKSSIFYNRVKGEMEQEVLKLKLKKTIFVRPSLLIGERNETRFMESIGIKMLSPIKNILAPILKSYTPVDANDVAESMIYLAMNKPVSNNNIEFQIFENASL